ncbi:MAG TPA: S8 family serine peptidase [Thermoanaerobaculia bacterium]
MKRISIPVLLALFLVPAVFAARPPRADRTKVTIAWADGRAAHVPVTGRELGGEDIAQYETYRVVALPAPAIAQLERRLREQGLRFTHRDDFDILYVPGAQLDTRREKSSYGVAGLHVLQLAGPPIPAWTEAIEAAGARIVSYVPQNGYLVHATAGAAQALGKLEFVQFVGVYEARLKAKSEAGVVELELAETSEAAAALDEIRRNDPQARETARYANRIIVRATLSLPAIERLLADPRIIGITSAAGEQRISDERQVMSVTSNLNVARTQPTNPTGYLSWFNSRCTYCSNLHGENFVVGIADTGLDGGSTGARHADLAGPASRMRYGAIFDGTTNDDTVGHGTMVAGIIAGNASTGARDANGTGFLLGMGIAPTAAILSTKISANGVITQTSNIFNWAFDATSRNVYIQNHSHNFYHAGSQGLYTQLSAQYDAAVRDSNGTTAGGGPITLAVASGNRDLGATNALVLPAGTGKNVISVGGAENYRDLAAEKTPNCRNVAADGFMTLARYSKRGTSVPNTAPDNSVYQWSTYIKPDLTAPMTFISSARPPVFGAYCNTAFYSQPYIVESGTSFAAPVAAGAAAVASRTYSRYLRVVDPALARPSLIKAMLIGTARSMEGGTNRLTATTSTTIGPRPNDQQGFGLLSLEDLLGGATAKTYVNEAHTFTASGQASWQAIYYRRDSSKPMRVALTWTDAPGPADDPGDQQPGVPPLMNDLDLYVNTPFSQPGWFPGTRMSCLLDHYGNNINTGDDSPGIQCNASTWGVGQDFRNNAELIVKQPDPTWPIGGVFVRVDPKQVGAQANPAVTGSNQDFSLYAYNLSQRGDLDHDGKVDFVWRHATSTMVSIWGAGDINAGVVIANLAHPWKIEALGDFNRDGSDDLVIRNPSTGEVSIWRFNKTTAVGTTAVATVSTEWEVSGAGDFDRDGHLDIVLRNYASASADYGKTRVWFMDGTTQVGSGDVTTVIPDANWRIEGVADFNRDGQVDLLWHHSSGAVGVWYMNGLSYITAVGIGTLTGAKVGSVGDYNDDSVNDIIWRNQTTGAITLWTNNNGTFTSSTWPYSTPDLNWQIAGPR